jgi:hypothetical protein
VDVLSDAMMRGSGSRAWSIYGASEHPDNHLKLIVEVESTRVLSIRSEARRHSVAFLPRLVTPPNVDAANHGLPSNLEEST